MNRFHTFLSAVSITTLLACGAAPVDVGAGATAHGAQLADDPRILNTMISEALQIDQQGAGPGDANLFLGADVDDSPSFDLPASTRTFIDWEGNAGDIENHRLLDLVGADGKDATAFPGSNECVGPANVLAKMDLTYVASANNGEYAYFAVQRSANNGDAGYYWLFTRSAPRLVQGEAPCGPSGKRLVYDITGPHDGATGDVLVKGHFKSSAEPLIEVFRATRDGQHLPASVAIDYTSSLWERDGGVAAAAVNTTPTLPGSFGAAGVKSMKGSNLDVQLFAESAVPLTTFTGGSACGATYYGSVITRSSGAGGVSPDLKDLAGPALFNFGMPHVTATMAPTCDGDATFHLESAIGSDGQPIVDPVCSWSFDGVDHEGTACEGTITLGTGAHTGVVTVVDGMGCGASSATNDVTLYDELSVAATLTPTCESSFTYDAAVTGGSPAGVDVAWTFTGSGTVAPEASTDLSGSVMVGSGRVSYRGDVVITDRRADGLICTSSSHDDAIPFAPLALSLHRAAVVPSCPQMQDDTVTYDAQPSGGDGAYVVDWSLDACDGATSCTLDPSGALCAAGELFAAVHDGSGLCATAVSETETYAKTTIIEASDL